MVELNASERKALTLAAVLVALGAAARLGFGPGPAAWAWSPETGDRAAGSAAEVRDAVDRELARARRASRPLAAGETLDPNRAPAVELERLPGVGPATARSILASRAAGRIFRWREDLLAVRGIGPATLARIAPHLTLAGAPPGLTTAPAGSRSSPATAGAAPRGRVDVNRATAAELESLPGVGPSIARRIIEMRAEKGGFARLEDLLAVRGIGPSRLAKLRDRVAFGRP